MEKVSSINKKKIMVWVKKVGFWGFMFFLIKGIIWLIIGWFGWRAMK